MPWWCYLLLLVVGLLLMLVIFFFLVAEVRFRQRYPEDPARDRTWGRYAERIAHAAAEISTYPKESAEIVSRDGLQLRGWFFPAEQARGSIVLMHGFRGEGLRDFTAVIPFYHRLGLHILVPDERAHGRSEGKYICFGTKERYDCADWLQWVNHRVGETLPLFLNGVSMGGTIVLAAQGLPMPANLRGVIADCGFTSPWEIMGHVCRNGYHCPEQFFLPICNALSRWLAGWDYREINTLEVMKTCRVPVLFIHGEKDTFVPPAMTLENYAACASEKELLLVEGAGHAVSFLEDTPRCEQVMEAFILRHCS